jgi:Reverse transcriptase (RNA-dependent DNA polymerase)
MDHKIDLLKKAGTWTIVPCLADKNVVRCKWVFRLKHKANSSIKKYKAWLIACGFTQVHRVDYFDTYSPVAKLSSFCMLLAMAVHFDWEVEAFDFNAAYLNRELGDGKEIYMQQLPGYEQGSTGSVKKLCKALYRLKQAGHKWYNTLTHILADLEFCISTADPGVFYTCIGDDILMLAVHVDDCAMTGSSPKLITTYKWKLNAHYALTELGPISWLLGIKVTHNCNMHTILLSQTAYIESILTCFSLTDAKAYSTPMVPSATYGKADSPSSQADATACARFHTGR